MYTLPKNTRITIRKIDKPLRALVTTCAHAWTGDKLAIVIANRIDKTGYGAPQFARIDLENGRTQIVPSWDGHREYIAIAPDEAIVEHAWRYNATHGDITIYLHAFTTLYDIVGELAVARDAMLLGDRPTAHRLAKLTLPATYGLFVAIVHHERRQMSNLRLTTADEVD